MTKSILIYYPPNKSSNVIETIAQGFKENGHSVFLLTQSPRGQLHANFENMGLFSNCYSITKKNAFIYYFKHVVFLISFCKKHNIQAVQSHLQQANIIAVFAQYFINAKTVICRHHLIEPNKMSSYFDKIINRLAKTIVVPSEVIRHKLIAIDKVASSKVKLINYVYDFTQYPIPHAELVKNIKVENNAHLILLLCGRFVPLKRNDIVFCALKQLVEENFDIKLLVLDEGPELEKSKKYVVDNNLQNKVRFLGYCNNVIDYMAACDVLVHPSYTEASNNTVKEVGILSKNVIVCEGVGDFSEYIIHKKNGYLANKENPLSDFVEFIKLIYNTKNKEVVGNELKNTVYNRFHKSQEIINAHIQILTN